MGAHAFSVSLKLGGRALSDELLRQIVHLEFVESIDELDALLVHLHVPNGANAAKALKLFQVGKTFALQIKAEAGTLEADGDIVEAGIRYEPRAGWDVTLRGLEGLHRLKGAQTPKLWQGAPNTFLSTIASRHGLSATAEGVDGNPPFTLQADEDDAMFVKRLARELNYYARVKGKKLLFGRRHVAKGAKVKVTLGSIRGLTLDSSLTDVVTKVTVVAEDPQQVKLVKAAAEPAKLKKLSGGDDGPKLRKSAFGAREEVLHNSYCTIPSLATAVATARLQRAAETFVRGRFRTTALPNAGSGQLVEIQDAPWPATGPFLIRQTRHIVDGRFYDTEVEFLSDTLPRKK